MNENKFIDIPGTLHSTAKGNIALNSDEVFDKLKNKKQQEINAEFEHYAEVIHQENEELKESLENLDPDQTEAIALSTKVNTIDNSLSEINVNRLVNRETPFDTKNQARLAVINDFRKLELKISYLLKVDENNSTLITEQFIGDDVTNWNDANNWKVVGPINVSQNTLIIGREEKGELAGQLIENPEWVEIVTDDEGKILYGVKTDGKFYFGADCPPQVVEYIQDKINELSLDEYEDIVTFLGDLIDGDTLATLLNAKLDKEGLDADALAAVQAVENPDFIQVTTDNEDKILEGITSDGVKHANLPIDTPSVTINHIENPEWSEIKTDNKQNIIEGVKKNASKHVSQFDKETLIKLTEDLTPLLNYRKIYPHNAIVSFIDDDTGEYIPDIWGEIIEETGIKMGFACIAGFMSGEITPTSPAYIQLPLEDLRTLYNNGHEVYSHSWSHHSFRISSFEQLETECQKAKDWLDANGFTRNSDIIVYPGGMGEKKIDEQTVIRRFYHYGVDTDTSDFGVNPEPVNEQCICRCNGDSLSLAELKARVDLAVERKHLLVIMCHAYELMHFEGVTPPSTSIGTKEQNIQRLIDLINYIKSLNIEILPVGEALHQIYGW